MTAFCVFGVKHSDCLIQAKKDVPPAISHPNPNWPGRAKTEFPVSQWSTYCDLLADHLFANTDRIKQISAPFDAPQFAHDWIAVAKIGEQIRHAKIMVKGQKKDKKGEPMVKKGKPVIGWIAYEPTGR